MAEEEGKKEDQFDFTPEGERLGYISMDQARILAMRLARQDTRFCTPARAGTGFVWSWLKLAWEVISCEEGEDYYDLKLAFRPSGRFLGKHGVEQFIIDKLGRVGVRQVLDELTDLGACPRCRSQDARPRYRRHFVNKCRCRGWNAVFPRPKFPAR